MVLVRIHLPMQETQEMWVRFLGREDPLEEGMVIYFNILAWRIPWTEEPGRLQSMEPHRVGHDWARQAMHYHCNKLPQTEWFKQHKFILLLFRRSEVQNQFHWAKSGFFWSLWGENLFPRLIHPLLANWIPWLMAPSSVFKEGEHHFNLCSHHLLFLPNFCLPLSMRTLMITLRVHLDNPG